MFKNVLKGRHQFSSSVDINFRAVDQNRENRRLKAMHGSGWATNQNTAIVTIRAIFMGQ
jgi:hypothetical protein